MAQRNFTNFKILITKYDKNLLQNIYYKDLLQSVTWSYYKVWQVLQSMTIITPWDVSPAQVKSSKGPILQVFFNGLVIAFWYDRVCEQLSLHILIGSTNSMHCSEKET